MQLNMSILLSYAVQVWKLLVYEKTRSQVILEVVLQRLPLVHFQL